MKRKSTSAINKKPAKLRMLDMKFGFQSPEGMNLCIVSNTGTKFYISSFEMTMEGYTHNSNTITLDNRDFIIDKWLKHWHRRPGAPREVIPNRVIHECLALYKKFGMLQKYKMCLHTIRTDLFHSKELAQLLPDEKVTNDSNPYDVLLWKTIKYVLLHKKKLNDTTDMYLWMAVEIFNELLSAAAVLREVSADYGHAVRRASKNVGIVLSGVLH